MANYTPLLLALFTCSSLASSLDLPSYSSCDVCLRNADFCDGTYRITKPGLYCLCEDIIFNPKPGDINSPNKMGSWFPTDHYKYPGSITHEKDAFALGWFAAITIESSHVTLDLQGFEMRMHRHFYIQQRFYNHIQVQRAVFLEGQGPAKFGTTIETIQNIEIKNGILGLSSHNGIHGFDTINVYIHDLKIHDFEVTGLQFNGFQDLTVKNVEISKSAQDMPFMGSYTTGRFALLGFELVGDKTNKYVTFQGGRKLNLLQIEDNLRNALDIMFRYELGINTKNDLQYPLFDEFLELFINYDRIPDGSTLYGMIFNSHGRATFGFGAGLNEEFNPRHGHGLKLENIIIDGLALNSNEVPTLMMDRCEDYYYLNKNELNIGLDEELSAGSRSITPILDKFGAAIDVRSALKYEDRYIIDEGNFDYDDIVYYGNVISDAQVALDIFMNPLYGANGDRNRGKDFFRAWAQDTPSYPYKDTTLLSAHRDTSALPECARFICNADCMFHLNKGVIGIRLDGIEYTEMTNIYVKNLHNKSPLSSNACDDYMGPLDGGHPFSLQREGAYKSDVRGISILNGGEIDIYGELKVDNLVSDYGDVIGIHLMDDVKLFVDEHDYQISNLQSGAMMDYDQYNELKKRGLVPYPNNFFECDIRKEDLFDRQYQSFPYDMNDYKNISSPVMFGGKGDLEYNKCRLLFDDEPTYSYHY